MVTLPKLESLKREDWLKLESYCEVTGPYRNILDNDPKNIEESLRWKRHNSWLRCAYSTLVLEISPEIVCNFWSAVSEKIIFEAWQEHTLDTSGVELLAFGKLGSQELNLSSDIDLVFVETKPHEKHTQLVRKFISLLSNLTSWGFCYRVDTDLRPGGSQSPLLSSTEGFINYFSTHGEPWLSLIHI